MHFLAIIYFKEHEKFVIKGLWEDYRIKRFSSCRQFTGGLFLSPASNDPRLVCVL